MTDHDPAPLETGWLPSTAVEDSYLRRFIVSWADVCAAAARAMQGRTQELPTVRLADAGRLAAFTNCATLTQPLARETAEATLAEIAVFFGFADGKAAGEVLLLSPWPSGDLRPYGWNLMGHPPIHLLPAGARATPPPPELNIEAVHSIDVLRDWERVAIRGFPVSGLEEAPPGSLANQAWLDEPRQRLWMGRVDGEPVSVAAAWVDHGINHVTVVATLPEARRHGYGEALTWAAAQADPALPAMLLSSDEGRRVYDRMGFLALQRVTLWYQVHAG